MSQAKIHEMVSSKNIEERRRAVSVLSSSFILLLDKEQGCQDLIRLAQDPDRVVRWSATHALCSSFALLPDKEKGWQVLLRLAQDQDISVRRNAAFALSSSFALLPDKEQGWQVLFSLTQYEDRVVRRGAADALCSSFALLPDKEQGWQVLLRLAQDQDSYVRRSAAYALRSAFAHLPDKEQGWQVLFKLAQDQDISVRRSAADALFSSFAHLPDKEQGCQVLFKLAQDQDISVRRSAADALFSSFALLPDKERGWQVLFKLAQDQDISVRRGVADSLGFAQLLSQAEIHEMASSRRIKDRGSAAYALRSAFALLPDKEQGWKDLLKLATDQDISVRRDAADALVSAFALLPDKEQGWKNLLKLAKDQDRIVRWSAADYLGSAFALLPVKEQGWQDLLRLAQDQDSYMRWGAADALGSSFAILPDKEQGWQILLRLAQDPDSYVRRGAASTLGSAFAFLPDKEHGWQVLLGLAADQDSDVRMYAYHSQGRVSIRKASESNDKNTQRCELEAAVKFFEMSSQEKSSFNPARFCHPFYRSYLALAFEGASESEVQRYLIEAKEAVGSSENRRELFGAVENLAKALEETQKLKEKSVEHIQNDLKAYQWYCDRAAEHMAAAEEKTPGVVRLLRKCNPIIEEKIKTIITGIQKTAREICQVTRDSGTKFEAPGARINQEAKNLSSENPLETYKASIGIATSLRELCRLLPKDKRGRGCKMLDEIEAELDNQAMDIQWILIEIDKALLYLQPNITLAAYESTTNSKLEEMHNDMKLMDEKFNTIIFDLSKIKIGSGDIASNLRAVRNELTKIAEMQKSSSAYLGSISKQTSAPNESQLELGNLIEAKVLDLEGILKTKATKEDNQTILNKLDSLKPPARWEWVGKIADVIAIFDASIRIFECLT